MPSQVKYIGEAIGAILLATITIATIDFIGRTSLIKDPPTIIDTDNSSTFNSEGRHLFLMNCATCHSLTKRVTGPALAGVRNRVQNEKLLISWIRNNEQVLRSGNTYFNKLRKEYDNVPMPLFPSLDDAQIRSILDYVDDEIKK